jgi:hypothetical protein
VRQPLPSKRLRLLPVSVAVAISVSVVAVTSAAAANYQQTFKNLGSISSGDQPIIVNVDVNTTFSSIQSVCLKFTFHGDLLDPGEDPATRETVTIVWGAINGFGFQSVTTAERTRTICLVAGFHDEELAYFLDGNESIAVSMRAGSVEIKRLTVTIDGVPA